MHVDGKNKKKTEEKSWKSDGKKEDNITNYNRLYHGKKIKEKK